MGRHRKRKKKHIYEYIPPKIEYNFNTEYNLIIEDSKIKYAGLGVFSNEKLKKNTYLGNYEGEKRHNDIFTNGIYAFSLKSDYYIDAIEYPRTVFAMINDSRFSNFDYNCEFKGFSDRVEIWTIKDISEGDELYCDYGDDYWINR